MDKYKQLGYDRPDCWCRGQWKNKWCSSIKCSSITKLHSPNLSELECVILEGAPWAFTMVRTARRIVATGQQKVLLGFLMLRVAAVTG